MKQNDNHDKKTLCTIRVGKRENEGKEAKN